jgi:hypothetical protein
VSASVRRKIEAKSAFSRTEHYGVAHSSADSLAELVASQVDIILAIASGSLEAARQASQTIPIVALDLGSDPIATGAAQSLI